MRTLHSLKGEAGMIGLSEVSDILHRTESAVKAHDDDPACADFVLRIKDWMQSLVRWLENPAAAETDDANTQQTNTPPAPTGQLGAEVTLPHADNIDYSDLVDDFLDDYLQSSHRRTKQLQDSIEQLRASGDGKELVTNFIGILNGLKGEAAMIGLSDVSKGLHEVEAVFKDHASSPKPCIPLLERCREWLNELVEHVEHMNAPSN
jgi:chemotaxis protein histidine kinase CheA